MSAAIELKGIEQKIAKAQAAHVEIQRQLVVAVTDVALAGEAAVVAATPVGVTGHLRQSITHTVSATPGGALGRVHSTDVPIKVAAVEGGRRPGKPPPSSALLRWVQVKLGGDASTAYLVARAIGRRGTKGHHMFVLGRVKAQAVARQRTPQIAAVIAKLF